MKTRWRQLSAGGPAAVASRILLAMSLLEPVRRLCSGGSFNTTAPAEKLHKKDEWGAPPPALGWTTGSAAGTAMCAACKLEPEGGVRTPCCSAWACYECLADAAHRTHKCPACAKSLSAAALPEVVADSDANGGNPAHVAATPRSAIEMESCF